MQRTRVGAAGSKGLTEAEGVAGVQLDPTRQVGEAGTLQFPSLGA